MGRRVLGVLCLLLGWSVSAATMPPLSADEWGEVGNELLVTDQKIQGEWKEKQTWDGWLCEGFYQYKLKFLAGIKKVDFELTDKGYVEVAAEIENVYARVDGGYRSKATLCLPSAGWLGLGIPWGRLKTQVHFGESGDMASMRLKIVSTELGRVQLGRFVPEWFEEFVTGFANRALSFVWNSRLGDWLSEKISVIARKKIAERGK